MRNTADVTGGQPIAVLLQYIPGVSAIFNPLVAFYDIHRGKRKVLFFYFVTDTTRDALDIMIMAKAQLTYSHHLKATSAQYLERIITR
jgi:hypothetical protein